MSTVVLGINAGHDSSACLLEDGTIRVAIQEERITRRKHEHGYPERAIESCLRDAERTPEQVDRVVINQFPTQPPPCLQHQTCFCERCRPDALINPSHHLLHAYYAWAMAGFQQDVAILIVDGTGYNYGEYKRRQSPCLGPAPDYSEMEEAFSTFVTKNGEISMVRKHWGLWKENTDKRYRFPSLGHLYSLASQYLFGSWTHAGKTMGLAPYGNPDDCPLTFLSNGDDRFDIHLDWIDELPAPDRNVTDTATGRNLAAKVQQETETALLYYVNQLFDDTGCSTLCISGGVGLNSVANGLIIKNGPFEKVLITPAAGDAGISIGAALYGYKQIEKKAAATIRTDYLGPGSSTRDVQSRLQEQSLIHARKESDPWQAAAREIAAGKVVGWFEGRSEFGPRALGHRSILADPRNPEMKDYLNRHVKFRESFRPYAASVLTESVPEYFSFDGDSPHMLVVALVHEDKQSVIPAVCHVDGTCRLQTVDLDDDSEYGRVIKAFERITGVPMVLNTSFNIRGEPIVETIEEAVNCFLGTAIDVLFIEGFRIDKHIPDFSGPLNDIPVLNPSLTAVCNVSFERTGLRPETPAIRWRTGYLQQMDEQEWTLIQQVDGQTSLNDIRESIFGDDDTTEDFVKLAKRLYEFGIISFQPPLSPRE